MAVYKSGTKVVIKKDVKTGKVTREYLGTPVQNPTVVREQQSSSKSSGHSSGGSTTNDNQATKQELDQIANDVAAARLTSSKVDPKTGLTLKTSEQSIGQINKAGTISNLNPKYVTVSRSSPSQGPQQQISQQSQEEYSAEQAQIRAEKDKNLGLFQKEKNIGGRDWFSETGKVVQTYEKINSGLSGFLGGFINEPKRKTGKSILDSGLFENPIGYNLRKVSSVGGDIVYGAEYGMVTEIKTRPLDVLTTFGAGVATGTVSRINIVGSALKAGTPILAGTYATSVGINVLAAPTTTAKGQVLGKAGLQVVSFAGGAKVGSLVEPPNVGLKLEKFNVPVKGGKMKTVYRGLSVEAGSRGQPLIGLESGKKVPTIGTPKIDLAKADLSKGFVVESASGTKILKESLPSAYGQEEITKFKLGTDIMRSTETTKSKFIQDTFIKESKTLSPKGIQEVLDITRKYQGTAYGSFPSRPQMMDKITGKSLGRMPGDIDVQFEFGVEKTNAIAQELLGNLQKTGNNVRISPQKGSLIESMGQDKQWHHAVDIHSMEDVASDLTSPAVAGEKIYGLRLGQKPIKIEGVKVMPLSEQGLRKGSSILTARESGFAPAGHRMKDIGDFFATQDVLLRSKLFSGKGLSKLAELKEMYPKELVSSGNAQIVLEAPKSPKARSGPSISKIIGSPAGSVSRARSPSAGSISPSRSVSGSLSPSISQSIGKSPSASASRLLSQSVSLSISSSRALSPSKSLSIGKSISTSASRMLSRSISPSAGSVSPSRSVSGSLSPSISQSISKILSNRYPKNRLLGMPKLNFGAESKSKIGQGLKREFEYTPSLVALGQKIRSKRKNKELTGLEVRAIVV